MDRSENYLFQLTCFLKSSKENVRGPNRKVSLFTAAHTAVVKCAQFSSSFTTSAVICFPEIHTSVRDISKIPGPFILTNT